MKTLNLFTLALILCFSGFAQGVIKSVAPFTNKKQASSVSPAHHATQENILKSSKLITDNREAKEWHIHGPALSHFNSLQDAIDSESVKNGDIIYIYTSHVANGYPGWGIYIHKDLEIIGITDNEFVSIRGGADKLTADRRCVSIAEGAKVIMRNIAFSDGNANDGEYAMGGAIYNSGHLTLDDVFILSNVSNFSGGGIHNSGYLEVTNSFISTNSSELGGAISNSGNMKLDNIIFSYCRASGFGGVIYTYGTGTGEIKNCRFEHSTAENSGAVHYNWGSIAYNNCQFWDNKAISYMGGAIINKADLYISECIFHENSAETMGGAISNEGSLYVSNCAFYKNKCNKNQGSAIVNFANMYLYRTTVSGNTGFGAIANSSYFDNTNTHANAHLINCTVTNNSDPDCSGVSLYEGSGSSFLSLINSIVAKNTGGGYDIKQDNAQLSLDGCNIVGTSDTSYLFMVSDMTGVDPLLGELTIIGGKIPYHKPKIESPAINAIPSETSNAESATSTPYFINSTVSPVGLFDIGAHESAEYEYNNAVWSIWEAYNHNFSTLNNAIVPWESNYIWHSEINNLHIGTQGKLHVIDPLEVKGKIFNSGNNSSLILYEDVEFKHNENKITVPDIASIVCQTQDAENYSLTMEVNSHALAFDLALEYGKNNEDYDLNQYNDTIRIEEKINSNSMRTFTYDFKAPGLINGYYRIRLTTDKFTFVTAPRQASIESGASNNQLSKGISLISDGKTLRIEDKMNEIIQFRLINMKGQCVFSCQPGHQQQIIEKQLVSGLYVVAVKTTKDSYFSKVLIQ